MAIGMLLIGGLVGHPEANQGNDGAGSIGKVINYYLMTGVSPVYDVKIEVPYSVNESQIVYYRMRFNDASLNAQIPLNASSTFKMTEVL